jgi:release factor glutamine methyltransferase
MNPPPTLLEILRKTEAFFVKAGVETARIDAEWLIAHVLGCKRLDLYLRFDQPLGAEVLDPLRALVKRRARREPLQHILGTVDFGGLTLRTDARALIPRPETEELLDHLAAEGRVRSPRCILDLGTGTGALALALAREFPKAFVVGVDRNPEALALARENAKANGLVDRVEWIPSDWFEQVPDQEFDWIVSNPPYLTEEEWETAQPEVRVFEPRDALVAPDEGRRDLEVILKGALSYLRRPGLVALETGIAQHESLATTAQKLGYDEVRSIADSSRRPRFFWASLT